MANMYTNIANTNTVMLYSSIQSFFHCIVPADPPANFSATAINSTAILLTWSEPPTPNGIVISYNISFSEMPTDIGSEINGHNQSINHTEPPVSLQVGARDDNSFLVTGLNEYTLYVFEIFASTRIGSGPSAWETARTHHTRKRYSQI